MLVRHGYETTYVVHEFIEGPDRAPICGLWNPDRTPDERMDASQDANARLIVAAPELLEALRTAESILWMAENYADAGGRGGPEWRDYEPAAAQIRSAIAKAEGRD